MRLVTVCIELYDSRSHHLRLVFCVWGVRFHLEARNRGSEAERGKTVSIEVTHNPDLGWDILAGISMSSDFGLCRQTETEQMSMFSIKCRSTAESSQTSVLGQQLKYLLFKLIHHTRTDFLNVHIPLEHDSPSGLRRTLVLVSSADFYCHISCVLTGQVELQLEGEEAWDLRAVCAVRTSEVM